MGKITRAQTGKTRYQRKSPSSAALDGQYGIKAAIRVSGSGTAAPSYADPVPPVLQVISQSARPLLRTTIASSKAGDTLRYEFAPQTTPQDWTFATVATVFLEANVAAGQAAIDKVLAALSNGLWVVRVLHTRAGTTTDWSNVVPFTVGPPVASVTAIRLLTNQNGRPTFEVDYINDYLTNSLITLEIIKNGVAEVTLLTTTPAVNGSKLLSFPGSTPNLVGGAYSTRAKIGPNGAWFAGPAVSVSIGGGGGPQPVLSNVAWATGPNRVTFDYANFTIGNQVQVKILNSTNAVFISDTVSLPAAGGAAQLAITNAIPPGTYTPAVNSPLANNGLNVTGPPFTIVAAGPNPVTALGLLPEIVGTALHLSLDITPAPFLPDDTLTLKIPAATGALLNQAVALTQAMIDGEVAIFAIPTLPAGANTAQVSVVRGGAAPVLSNIASYTIPAPPAAGLVARALAFVTGGFTNASLAYPPITLSTPAAARKVMTLIVMNGDNGVRPSDITLEGVAAAPVKTFVDTNGASMQVLMTSDATATAWDVVSQFKTGAGVAGYTYRSIAAAIQLEGALGTVINEQSVSLFATTSFALPSMTVPANSVAYACLIISGSVGAVSGWTGGGVDDTALPYHPLRKFVNATSAPVTWSPVANTDQATNGMIVGFVLPPA